MKNFIITYILFVYTNYIENDMSDLNIVGKITLLPAEFIRKVIMALYSIVCFPLVLTHMYIDKHKDKIEEMLEFIYKEINFS